MGETSDRQQSVAEGHNEQKGYARLAHSELRAKGIQRFRDEAGREYWISENVLQIIMPDGSSEVRYNLETDSITIKGEGARQLVGYEEFAGDFSPFVNAIGMAQTIALSDDPGTMGTIVNGVSTGQDSAAGSVAGVLHS